MREHKVHFADLLYSRPACGAGGTRVTREEGVVSCGTCRRILKVEGVPCTVHGDAVHGGEAEELRAGIEKILSLSFAYPYEIQRALQRLLDDVNARDSLAWLEHHDEKHAAEVAKLKVRIAELESADKRTVAYG